MGANARLGQWFFVELVALLSGRESARLFADAPRLGLARRFRCLARGGCRVVSVERVHESDERGVVAFDHSAVASPGHLLFDKGELVISDYGRSGRWVLGLLRAFPLGWNKLS